MPTPPPADNPIAASSSPRGSLWSRATDHPFKTIFVLALAVRLANIALLRGDDSFFAEPDTRGYWAMGAALAKSDAFWPELATLVGRMPLYPIFLAFVQAMFGNAPRLVAIVQAVIDAGTCTLVAALGALLSSSVGLLAGIVAALSLTLVVFSTQMVTDTLFLFFFTLMLLAGAWFMLKPANGLALLAGLAGGLALATRSAAAMLLGSAVPLVFAVAIVRKRSVLAAVTAALLFAIAAAAPVAPLLLRNVMHYGTFDLTTQTSEHLAFWIVPLVTQRADGTPYQVTRDRVDALYQTRLAESGLSTETNPFRRAQVMTAVAREQMAQLPPAAYVKAWLEGMVVNLGTPALLHDPRVRALPKPSFYNIPGASLWERARAYVFDDPGRFQVLLIAGLVAMVPLLALEAIGLVVLARTQPWAAVLAGCILAYFLLLNGPVAAPKYRMPMEPVLIVLTAIPLAWLVERRRRTSAPG
jgi:4-amino-4-deoxy-L-arabinose transferase-like glycosyltransferase